MNILDTRFTYSAVAFSLCLLLLNMMLQKSIYKTLILGFACVAFFGVRWWIYGGATLKQMHSSLATDKNIVTTLYPFDLVVFLGVVGYSFS